VTFVVDSSGSINALDPTNYAKCLQFVADVVREFDIGPDDVQISFVLFGREATVEWDFTAEQDKDKLIQDILAMRYLDSWTNLNDALYLTRTKVYGPNGGAREGSVKATVILTDGEDNIPELGTPLTIENATLCKEDGIWLIAVGVTQHLNVSRLHEIISSPSDYYPVDDFDALPTIVDDLKSKICPEISKCQFFHLLVVILYARCYACAVYAMALCPSVKICPGPDWGKFYLVYIFTLLLERYVDHAFLSHLRYCHFLRIYEKISSVKTSVSECRSRSL